MNVTVKRVVSVAARRSFVRFCVSSSSSSSSTAPPIQFQTAAKQVFQEGATAAESQTIWSNKTWASLENLHSCLRSALVQHYGDDGRMTEVQDKSFAVISEGNTFSFRSVSNVRRIVTFKKIANCDIIG